MARVAAVAALLVLAVACVCARPKWYELTSSYSWEQYKADFGKHYSGRADAVRKGYFEASLAKVLSHNAKESSWKLGMNHMADWSPAEVKSTLGYHKGVGFQQVVERERKRDAGALKNQWKPFPQAAPHEVDWRGKGVLTSVKDQGQCGSCWSFASAEAIESAWAIATGELNVLSEQHILSCTANPQHCGGDGGCYGGTTELAFESMITAGGIASEWKYPYLSWYGNNSRCGYTEDKVGSTAVLKGYTTLPTNDYDSLLQAVAFVGPIAVSVDASTWHLYDSGVFNGCDEDSPDINHAVLLVGYGYDSGLKMPFWAIRNSWTPNWGEKGFIRIFRNENNQPCGTDTTPLDGVGCIGGPDSVTVCGTCGVLFDSAYPIVQPPSS